MNIQEQNNKTCNKCKEDFIFMPDETKWINYGTYSVKVVTCPYCSCINSVKYEESSGLHINEDNRYYK